MNEFYIGYVPRAPGHLARFVRRTIILLGVTAVAVSLTLVLAQSRNDAKSFEFGAIKRWEGTIAGSPYPMLITRGGPAYLLVAPGKHGFDASGLSGRAVSLDGTLIRFANNSMLEVTGLPSVRSSTDDSVPYKEANLGSVTLEGEIVDTKCFFGVMQPGTGKVHRACAARCIAGGIPPGLLVHEAGGKLTTVLLADRSGAPLRHGLLNHVAEKLKLTGTLIRTPAGLLLRTSL